MLMDKLAEFCDATAVNTGAAGNYLIGSQYDQGAGALVGEPADLYFVVQVSTACASAGSGTMQFKLASDDSAAVHTTTSTVHITSPVIAAASLVAGYRWACKLPVGQTYERYLGVIQVTGTAAFESGNVDAFLTDKVPTSTSLMSFPDGI